MLLSPLNLFLNRSLIILPTIYPFLREKYLFLIHSLWLIVHTYMFQRLLRSLLLELKKLYKYNLEKNCHYTMVMYIMSKQWIFCYGSVSWRIPWSRNSSISTTIIMSVRSIFDVSIRLIKANWNHGVIIIIFFKSSSS
jgi:hypothetical protein